MAPIRAAPIPLKNSGKPPSAWNITAEGARGNRVGFGLIARLGKHCRELGKGQLNARAEFSNDRSVLAGQRRNYFLTLVAELKLGTATIGNTEFRTWKPHKQKSQSPMDFRLPIQSPAHDRGRQQNQ